MEKSMFYGAKPKTFEKARWLRGNMTEHEKMLWGKLKSNQLLSLRFKAQHPVGPYIADFYCHKFKLVVELDGPNHQRTDQAGYDENRDLYMIGLGIKVLRFTNYQIEEDLESVLEVLKGLAQEKL